MDEKSEKSAPVRPTSQWKDLALSWSLASLCLANVWFPLLYSKNRGYFSKLAINWPTLLAFLTNLAVLTLVFWLLCRFFRSRRHPRWRFVAHAGLMIALIPVLEFVRAEVLQIKDATLVTFLLKPAVAAAVLGCVALALWMHRRVALVLHRLVLVMTPLAALVLIRTLILAATLGGPTPAAPAGLSTHLADPALTATNRVIWLIFDEMDYRLIFEKPLPGLAMPAVQALVNEAIHMTNATPPGDSTLVSIPALTTGKELADTKVANASDLSLAQKAGTSPLLWTQQESIFSAVRRLGFATALVGWYHPYSRIFEGDLDYCFWEPMSFSQHLRAETYGAALFTQAASIGRTLYWRHRYGRMCETVMERASEVATNAAFGLTMLHVPPPHLPGVYNPQTGRVSIIPVRRVVGYRNNLIWADRFLARIQEGLRASGEWDDVWLIVTSDHSWRDSAIVDGVRDKRVPFLVKAPGHNASILCGREFNTLKTGDFVLDLLRGRIQSQADALEWIEANQVVAHCDSQPENSCPTKDDQPKTPAFERSAVPQGHGVFSKPPSRSR